MRSRSRAKSIDLRQAKKKLIINLWVLLVCLLALGWGLRKVSVLMLGQTHLNGAANVMAIAQSDLSSDTVSPYDSSDDDDDDDTVVV